VFFNVDVDVDEGAEKEAIHRQLEVNGSYESGAVRCGIDRGR
jgi:hypothetical protein